jgi:zinc transporter ZupT
MSDERPAGAGSIATTRDAPSVRSRRRRRQLLVYLIIGGVALIVGTTVGIWMAMRVPPKASAATKAQEPGK